MLIDYQISATGIIVRVKVRSSSTGNGLTGLSSTSSGLIISTIADSEATATVYTVAASHVQTIATLGTYAAPSASSCRFQKVDDTNHPGVVELQFANARFAVSGALSLLVSITGVSGMLDTDVVIPLRAINPYSTGFGLVNASANVVQVNGQAASLITGTAQAGASTSITLASGDTAPNNGYAGRQITLVGGTGAGQWAYCLSYNSTTKVATIYCTAGSAGAWVTNPDATTQYNVDDALDVNVALILQTLSKGAAGSVAPDWGQVQNKTTTNVLSGTTISTSQVAASVTAAVTLSLTQALSAARALDAIADTSLTLNDALHCAIAAEAGKQAVSGTSYTVKTPSTGTVLRTFTLDSGTSPTSRS